MCLCLRRWCSEMEDEMIGGEEREICPGKEEQIKEKEENI